MAVGTDNLTRLLWNSGSGVFSLWRVNADASVTAFPFGPYAGWTASQVAVGTDNVPRILWNYSDGTCAIDTVSESTGGFTSLTFGPYPGWSATALAMSGTTPRLLWNKTDGTASLYSINSSGGYTYAQFGPYAGYTAKFLAVGPNAAPCLLWTNPNGQVALWTSADASNPGSALVYSAPTGCVPLALTVDAGNAPRLLWNNASAQTVTLWTITNGVVASQSYPYPSGCTPVGLGAATDGSVRVLWNNPGGVGSVPPGSAQVGIVLGDGIPGPTLNLGPVATNDPPQIGGSWVLDHYLCSGSTVYGTSPFTWPAIVKVTNGKCVSYSDTSASPVTNTALSFLTSASDGYSTSVSGTITPVFVWSGPGNAPAGQVNVLVMPDAYGTGSVSNATDGFASDVTTFQTYAYASSGTHLETTTVTASQASFAVAGLPMMMGTDPRGIFQAGVSMNASLTPYNLTVSGTTPDANGNANILIGQGCTASLSGIPSGNGWGMPVYNWGVSGTTTFQTWQPTTPANPNANPPILANPNASYFVPYIGTITNPTVHWYWTEKSGVETVACGVTLTPPAGQGSTFSFTVSRQVTVVEPTYTCYYFNGVPFIPPDGTKLQASGTSNAYPHGASWLCQVQTPTLFGSGGSCNFSQIITPGRSHTYPSGTVSCTENTKTGLDTVCPYPATASDPYTVGSGTNVGWPADNIQHQTGDSPSTATTDIYGNRDTATSISISESFKTFLMYVPPGSDVQPVPLHEIDWNWAAMPTEPVGGWGSANGMQTGAITSTASTRDYTHPSWTRVEGASVVGTGW